MIIDLHIRPAKRDDGDAIWAMLEPVVRDGQTYALPRTWAREEALTYWLAPEKETFVADDGHHPLGTFYLRVNQLGGGSHVANCGYVTSIVAQGKGVARRMCELSQQLAKERGFTAMQFNCVVSSNERAVRLWQSMGFQTIGKVPGGFLLPHGEAVDALIMHKDLR